MCVCVCVLGGGVCVMCVSGMVGLATYWYYVLILAVVSMGQG